VPGSVVNLQQNNTVNNVQVNNTVVVSDGSSAGMPGAPAITAETPKEGSPSASS